VGHPALIYKWKKCGDETGQKVAKCQL